MASPHPSPRGHVTLVGTGPGDADLLTVKAIRAIRNATVLLVDDLVGDGVLRYARASARIIHVGKRGGCRSTPQTFIQRLMISHARRGERVARLKGGDPFVFGRGGEEVEALQQAGIDVAVINGITSGLAAACALNTPWTHRNHAHGVMLVTGHLREASGAASACAYADASASKGSSPSAAAPTPSAPADTPHWPTLGAAAAQGLTLVVYMGMSNLASIIDGLRQSLPPTTPAALVQSATTVHERRLVSTIEHLLMAAQQQAFGSPAVLIVGNVLRGALSLELQRQEAIALSA